MITLDGVSKVYRTRSGRRTVLDNVNVTFESGHNFGVLGVNGSGKSTLIRLLAGSEYPISGLSGAMPGCRFRLASAARFTVAGGGEKGVVCRFVTHPAGATIYTSMNLRMPHESRVALHWLVPFLSGRECVGQNQL